MKKIKIVALSLSALLIAGMSFTTPALAKGKPTEPQTTTPSSITLPYIYHTKDLGQP